jgi:hypothetical protein
MDRRAATLIGSVIASIVVLASAGCGGSSRTSTTVATQEARQVKIASPDVGAAAVPAKTHGGTRSAAGGESGHHGRQTAGSAAAPNDEHSGTGAKPLNPCKLVSSSELGAIAHQQVTSQIEAPLGPTCIFKLRGAPSDITLTVESAGFPQLVHQMRKPRRVTVRGHTGYCGSLGRPTLYLSLGGGRVMSIAATCNVTVAVADKALGRLTA